MVNLARYFLPALLGTAGLWALLTAVLLTRRAVVDRVRAKVRQARQRVQEATDLGVSDGLAAALGGLSPRMVERLAADAGIPDREAAVFATEALARGGDRILRQAAGSRWRPWARIRALWILARGNHPEAIAQLEAALESGDLRVVGAAVTALGTMDRIEAAERLVSALRRRRYPASRVATQIEGLRVPVPHLLRKLLADPQPVVRYWGATLLYRTPDEPGLEEALAPLGKDPDPAVRKATLQTLARVGGDRARQVGLDLLADPVPFVRAHAARALGAMGDATVSARITPLLADQEWWVRLAAKEALGALGPACGPAVASALDADDRFARNGAAEVLQNLGILEHLVRQAAAGTLDEAGHTVLRKTAAAGGPGILAGLLDAVPETDRPRLRELALDLGYAQAGP